MKSGPMTELRCAAALVISASVLALSGCDQPAAPKAESAAAPAVAAPASVKSETPATDAVIPLAGPFNKETGFCWTITAPTDPDVRKLRLLEDGKELGPADAIHDDIRHVGQGRYSHWKATDGSVSIYFSTSDNSDPNTNGRTYELR